VGVSELSPNYPFKGIRPVVTAFEQQRTTFNAMGSCDQFCNAIDRVSQRTSLDSLVGEVGGRAYWDNEAQGSPAYSPRHFGFLDGGEKLKLPFCGLTQRIVYETSLCSQMDYQDASGQADYPSTATVGGAPTFGCMRYEPRTFSLSCAAGVCDAGGVCVAQSLHNGQLGAAVNPTVVDGEGVVLTP
jgi:hypothetical protein